VFNRGIIGCVQLGDQKFEEEEEFEEDTHANLAFGMQMGYKTTP